MNQLRLHDVIRPTLLAAAAAALIVGSAAGAQTSAPAAGDETPRTRNPFWGGGSSNGGGTAGGQSDNGDESNFDDEFPVDLAADVPVTKERYVALRAAYRSAQQRLAVGIANFRTDFEASEDYQQFLQERDAAQAALEQARADALAPLKDDAEYQAAGEIRQDLQRQIKAAHEGPGRPDMSKIRGMSELALEYATQRKAKEQALIQDDSAVLRAKDRLKAVGRRQGDLEAEYDRMVRQDQKLEDVRRQNDELRIGYLAAGARYDATVQAADLAADFAYFRAAANSRDNYSPYGYGRAGGYGYGYGGYTGFGGGFGYSPFFYGGGLYGGLINANGVSVRGFTPSRLGNSIVGGPGNAIIGGVGNTVVPGAAAGQ